MRRDEDGFFHFLGRADDMFVVGGENVWPGEVERLIERMPGVHQALVVPVPDEIKGALPFAFVVPQPGAPVDGGRGQGLRASPTARPSRIPASSQFCDEIPLAATNKPDRRRLDAPRRRAAARARARSLLPVMIAFARTE